MTTGGGGSDDIARQLQPHLAAAGAEASHHGDGLVNPALALGEEDVHVSVRDTPRAPHDPSSSSSATNNNNPTWERFDDDSSGLGGGVGDGLGNGTALSRNGNSNPNRAEDKHLNGKTLPPNIPPPHHHHQHQQQQHPQQKQQQTSSVQHPVLYNCQSGQAVVVPGDVTTVTTTHGGGGGGGGGGSTVVIATGQIPERWRDLERPLRARQMKILKILSVVAAVVFFPTGIPAAYFAWRTKREFDAGILRGNIDRAQKFARRTERLIVLSAILVVLVAVLVFALVERSRNGYTVDHSYVAHASVRGR